MNQAKTDNKTINRSKSREKTLTNLVILTRSAIGVNLIIDLTAEVAQLNSHQTSNAGVEGWMSMIFVGGITARSKFFEPFTPLEKFIEAIGQH